MSRRSSKLAIGKDDDDDPVMVQSLADRIEQRAQRLQTTLATEPCLRKPRIKITQAPEPKRYVMPADIDLDADPATLCSPKYDGGDDDDSSSIPQYSRSSYTPFRSSLEPRKSYLAPPSYLSSRSKDYEPVRKTAFLSPGYKPKTKTARDPLDFYEQTFVTNRAPKEEEVEDRLDVIRRRTTPEIKDALQRCRPVEDDYDEDGDYIGPRRRSQLYRNADIVFTPGRRELKQKPVDPKAGEYEKKRAKDAYRKQMEIFKIRFEAHLKSFTKLDFDAKQEIRIRAKRQREMCLANYRESLQGLATTSHRRNYRDTFLGDCETSITMHDPNILEYELRLTSEMDTIINNLKLLNEDQSNRATLDWMASLAKQKFSYEYELDEPELVAEIPEPPEEVPLELEPDLETGSQCSEAPYSVPYSDYDPSEAGSMMNGYPPVMRSRYRETPETDSLRFYPITGRPRQRIFDFDDDTGSLLDYPPRRPMSYYDDDTDSLASYSRKAPPPQRSSYFDDTDSLSSYPRSSQRTSGLRYFDDTDSLRNYRRAPAYNEFDDTDSLVNYRVRTTGRPPIRGYSPATETGSLLEDYPQPRQNGRGVNGHREFEPEVIDHHQDSSHPKGVHFKRDTSLVEQFDGSDREDPL